MLGKRTEPCLSRNKNMRPQTKKALYADKDLKSLESVMNIELQKDCDWLNANKLTIIAKKSNFVIFRP